MLPEIVRTRADIQPTKRLPIWALKFAAWRIACPYTPNRQEQELVATRLANEGIDRTSQREVKIGYAQIKRLRTDARWQEYVRVLEDGGIMAARQLFVDDLPAYVALHRWGAEEARKAGDYKTMPAFTVPALDRAVPKRTEGLPATQIAIVLAPERIAGLRREAEPVVSVEVLPVGADATAD
jgi:hypothetical protein